MIGSESVTKSEAYKGSERNSPTTEQHQNHQRNQATDDASPAPAARLKGWRGIGAIKRLRCWLYRLSERLGVTWNLC